MDPSWPKIPNGWVFGEVASAATDEQDNVWVLQRSREVRPGQKTGPPVMEFDEAGNLGELKFESQAAPVGSH